MAGNHRALLQIGGIGNSSQLCQTLYVILRISLCSFPPSLPLPAWSWWFMPPCPTVIKWGSFFNVCAVSCSCTGLALRPHSRFSLRIFKSGPGGKCVEIRLFHNVDFKMAEFDVYVSGLGVRGKPQCKTLNVKRPRQGSVWNCRLASKKFYVPMLLFETLEPVLEPHLKACKQTLSQPIHGTWEGPRAQGHANSPVAMYQKTFCSIREGVMSKPLGPIREAKSYRGPFGSPCDKDHSFF